MTTSCGTTFGRPVENIDKVVLTTQLASASYMLCSFLYYCGRCQCHESTVLPALPILLTTNIHLLALSHFLCRCLTSNASFFISSRHNPLPITQTSSFILSCTHHVYASPFGLSIDIGLPPFAPFFNLRCRGGAILDGSGTSPTSSSLSSGCSAW